MGTWFGHCPLTKDSEAEEHLLCHLGSASFILIHSLYPHYTLGGSLLTVLMDRENEGTERFSNLRSHSANR